jgi:hypothetical protein
MLGRFRFRSPERDRESDERRLGLIRMVARSAIADAEAEATGLRARIAEARRSGIFLVQGDKDGEFAPKSRAALANRDHHLRTIDLAYLRRFGRRLDRLVDRITVQ